MSDGELLSPAEGENKIEDAIVVMRNHVERLRRTWRHDEADAIEHALETMIGEPDHIFIFGDDGWSVSHPIVCKGNGPLHECPFHLRVKAAVGDGLHSFPEGEHVVSDLDTFLESHEW